MREKPLNPNIIKPEECRAILGVGANKMYKIIWNEKDFPKFRIGRNWYIDSGKLQGWIDSKIGTEIFY